jgi:hypothetical protein
VRTILFPDEAPFRCNVRNPPRSFPLTPNSFEVILGVLKELKFIFNITHLSEEDI